MRSTLEIRIADLPADLSGIIGKTSLIRMAFEAVDAANWPRPRSAPADRTPEAVLRTLLPFCYATGLFSSNEISSIAKDDSAIRYLCANDFPTFEEVRVFRRQNISHLRETFARLLHAAWSEIEPDQPEIQSFYPFLAEADRRIHAAIEADTAALDD